MRIFAIDDDPIVTDLLEVMLSDIGYSDVEFANDAKRAQKKLHKSKEEYDCILLDISMPNVTGIELCASLRTNPNFAEIPIIMMTALADKDSVDKAFRAGATDYVNKPFDVAELETRLRVANGINEKRRNEAIMQSEFPLLNVGTRIKTGHVKVHGVEDVIEYTALCNYLAHLSLAGLGARQVVAVQLHEFKDMTLSATEQELGRFLSSIAEVIAEAYQTHDCMMSYFGEGAFIVVTEKSDLESSALMEEQINQALYDKKQDQINRALNDGRLDYVDDPTPVLEVSIGDPIRPNKSKTQRVRRTFDRAVDRALSRLERKMKNRLPSSGVLRLVDTA